MNPEKFRIEGSPCQGYRFTPEAGPPRGVMHVVHGMAEHALRYRPLAEALTADGWIVYAHDQRGHGATAMSRADLGVFADRGGWALAVGDLRRFVGYERAEHPSLPLVVFGHSMGAFIVQDYISSGAADVLAAAILSGPGGPPPPIAHAGRLLARAESWRLGRRGRSATLQAMTFGAYNKSFKPTRTAFDWLSKDPAQVDKYIEDPLCGFEVANQFWVDMLDILPKIHGPARIGQIPKDLPIYIFAGELDPVGRQGQGPRELKQRLLDARVTDVELKLYPTGRHEMLNEINREEVVGDIGSWLARRGLPPAEVR